MSPEQAAGRGHLAGVTSDVYGLGATLYAALAGRSPFTGSDVLQTLRAIVEDEPTDLRRLRPGLDRDLCTIVHKCLAKEPERRYATAAELAGDLSRWLERQPILARPPSFGYRLTKFVARRRALLKASAVVVLVTLLIVAIVVVPMMIAQAGQRSSAEKALTLGQQVAAVLADARLQFRSGRPDIAQQRLDRGISDCQEFLASFPIGQGYYFLGRLLHVAGRDDESVVALDRAVAMRPEVAEVRFLRGLVRAARYRDREAMEGSFAASSEAAAWRQHAITDLATEVSQRADLERVDELMGGAHRLWLQGDLERAERTFREVFQMDPSHAPSCLALSRLKLARGDATTGLLLGVFAASLLSGQPSASEANGESTQFLEVPNAGFAAELGALLGPAPNDGGFAARGQSHLLEAAWLEQAEDRAAALQRYELAVSDFTGVVTLLPAPAHAYNNRGLCHAGRARQLVWLGRAAEGNAAREQARGDFADAIHLERGCAAAHLNRALVNRVEARAFLILLKPEMSTGVWRLVRADLRRALEIAPSNWAPRARAVELLREAELFGDD
jgi:tetratricopeptide (TPR) repeat protein